MKKIIAILLIVIGVGLFILSFTPPEFFLPVFPSLDLLFFDLFGGTIIGIFALAFAGVMLVLAGILMFTSKQKVVKI